MTDSQNFGFAKLVPGFDFLQNLAQGGAPAGLPQMPNLSHWVAPTLDLEELDKRIQELKAVQFWLEQNSKVLAATVQALEVQKMTLATLKGMNYQMADLAEAMKVQPQAASAAASRPAAAAEEPAPKPAAASPRRSTKAKPSASAKAQAGAAGAAGVIDPMQWWGSLTQQFQHIASQAMKDVAQQGAAAAGAAQAATHGAAKETSKAAAPASKNGAKNGAAKASRPSSARKTPSAPGPQARSRR